MNFYVFGAKKFIINSCYVMLKNSIFFLENIVIVFYPFLENFIKKYIS